MLGVRGGAHLHALEHDGHLGEGAEPWHVVPGEVVGPAALGVLAAGRAAAGREAQVSLTLADAR